MSATAVYGDTLDISNSLRTPMTRLTKVELRKMVDTKAGLWLLITIGVLTAAIVVIFGLAAGDSQMTFSNFMGASATPQGFLLPVLGILLVTQEWGQRTGMVTFTLEPHRARVMWAKVFASLILGLAALVTAIVVAALATVVFGSGGGFDDVVPVDFLKFGILQVTGVLQGLAFGLIFLNSAAAIVVSFVLPIAFSLVSNLWSALQNAAPWIDLGTAQTPLFDSGNLSGQEWAQVTTTILIWVVLPFTVGLWRMLRAEIK